jgi:hypothetical protein
MVRTSSGSAFCADLASFAGFGDEAGGWRKCQHTLYPEIATQAIESAGSETEER